MSAKPPYKMRESRVPSSQLGRLLEFGGLAASMAFGAAGERFNRSTSNYGEQGSFMLSAGNMDRLVAKLSKMRGAALKLGQMMSFQGQLRRYHVNLPYADSPVDSKMLPKPIHEVLQRVQDSADYMPASQRNAVLAADLGNDWRDLFESFDEQPMAAASIGQVHGGVMRSSGQRVAVKVQYPGVAASISSDLNNLSILLNATRLLPKGLYLDKTIANARTELAWECDYVREAESAKRFQELLADEMDTFTVPAIIDEASGKQVLTMERMEGMAVTKIQTFAQEQKDWIGTQILRLCLREIIEFNFMQTDPNWTNFLYNSENSRLELLDFGASREFPQKFINLYVQNLAAAARGNRDACRTLSIELGYLTGYESKAMLNAHVDSVMTLAEPFTDTAPDVYDFENQTITDRVRGLIPVMIRERLAPPPEETYSLHRKLSGAFLLCARLGSRVRCKEMFQRALVSSSIV
jgi:aarF domain-containing kinase